MNDATVIGAPPGASQDYRDTVYLAGTRFPMARVPLAIPGNPAAAAGPEIDFAVVRVDGTAEDSLARAHEAMLIAPPLPPKAFEDAQSYNGAVAAA